MRVLYVRDSITVHDRRFIQAILDQQHVPIVVQLSSSPDVTSRPETFGTVTQLPMSAFTTFAAEHSIDVVHAGPMHSVAAEVARHLPSSLPLVSVSWGSDVLYEAARSDALRAAALIAIDRADAILVDCLAVQRKLLAWRPRLATPIISFPWGVDPSQYCATDTEWRRQLGWNTQTVFISTRSWEPIYGIETLVRAFERLLRARPDVRLVLGGDGSLRERIGRQIESAQLQAFVHRPGRLTESDLPRWYAGADVYVSSSLCDGTSVSLLEAMASSKPVVVHRDHGNCEWVTQNENGWLVDCRHDSELAAGMQTASLARAHWEAIGRNNRETVLRLADWRKNSMKLSGAYEHAKAGRRQ